MNPFLFRLDTFSLLDRLVLFIYAGRRQWANVSQFVTRSLALTFLFFPSQ